VIGVDSTACSWVPARQLEQRRAHGKAAIDIN